MLGVYLQAKTPGSAVIATITRLEPEQNITYSLDDLG